jgi:hypothetical protein
MSSELLAACVALEDPHFELTAEEAAAILAAIDKARRQGQRIGRLTLALCAVLRRQLAETDDGTEDATDSDSDVDDAPAVRLPVLTLDLAETGGRVAC